jgi:acetyl esterase/lipase
LVIRKVLGGLGMLTAATGLLISWRTLDDFNIPQIALNETAWLPAAVGTAVTAASVNRRARLGWAFGALGVGLSALPLLEIRRTINDIDSSMVGGFGADYVQRIPPEALRRASQQRISLDGFQTAAPSTLTRDLVYAERELRTLKLDVYQPTIPPVVGERYPAVLALHGGGWRSGDKGGYFEAHHRTLAGQGIVVFDAQYRFTSEAPWPAQLDDVRTAMRWIRVHAADYQIDPDKIVLLGRSAGGHLALQAAYRATGDDADTAVSGVIGIYAPTNLRLMLHEHDARVIALVGGTSDEVPEAYADASPLDFAERPDLPPTLLIHGYRDDVVGPVHAELLLNKLRYQRVPSALLRLPWSRHGFDGVTFGVGAPLVQYYMDRFLGWSFYRDVV